MFVEHGRERIAVALLRNGDERTGLRVGSVKIPQRRVQVPLRVPPADNLPRRRSQQAELRVRVRTVALIQPATVEQMESSLREKSVTMS